MTKKILDIIASIFFVVVICTLFILGFALCSVLVLIDGVYYVKNSGFHLSK